MNFFISLTLDKEIKRPSLRFETGSGDHSELSAISLTELGNNRRDVIYFQHGVAMIVGDPVYHGTDTNIIKMYLERGDLGSVIRNTDGFYYLFVVFTAEQKLIIASGSFNILPVYYSAKNGLLGVSSSIETLIAQMKVNVNNVDNQYYLEKALFYYPFLNHTPLKEVSILPSNSLLEYSDSGFRIYKHTNMYDYFTLEPKSWRSTKEEMSDLFIEKARDFIPGSPAIIALTGGFDSRTVSSIFIEGKALTGAYSYGNYGDIDISIAAEIAGINNVKHIPVILDDQFAEREFWHHGLEFMKQSHGLGNLSRAHYHYILENHLKGTPYIISGNFGSELLRSANVWGVVLSEALFNVFKTSKEKDLLKRLRAGSALAYLNPSIYEEFIMDLVEEIQTYLNDMPSWLTTNQKFYIYIFEEVFRKYFGPEIIVQSKFVNHRAPFLCFSFIEGILKTGFAGANSQFMERNPLKRFRGQMLYSLILKKTSPQLLTHKLDRGYRPLDLMTSGGKANIALGYIKKRIASNRSESLPGYLSLSLKSNLKHFLEAAVDDELFDRFYLHQMISGKWGIDQINFINTISAVLYRNYLGNRF